MNRFSYVMIKHIPVPERFPFFQIKRHFDDVIRRNTIRQKILVEQFIQKNRLSTSADAGNYLHNVLFLISDELIQKLISLDIHMQITSLPIT